MCQIFFDELFPGKSPGKTCNIKEKRKTSWFRPLIRIRANIEQHSLTHKASFLLDMDPRNLVVVLEAASRKCHTVEASHPLSREQVETPPPPPFSSCTPSVNVPLPPLPDSGDSSELLHPPSVPSLPHPQKGGDGGGGGEHVGGRGGSGYEKRHSGPSPRILLLQDIDIWTGTPGRPHRPRPAAHFHKRAEPPGCGSRWERGGGGSFQEKNTPETVTASGFLVQTGQRRLEEGVGGEGGGREVIFRGEHCQKFARRWKRDTNTVLHFLDSNSVEFQVLRLFLLVSSWFSEILAAWLCGCKSEIDCQGIWLRLYHVPSSDHILTFPLMTMMTMMFVVSKMSHRNVMGWSETWHR